MMFENEEINDMQLEAVYEVGDTYTDEFGEWLVTEGNGRLLIKPTEKYFESQKLPETTPAPTLEDYLLELDFRLSNIELGL